MTDRQKIEIEDLAEEVLELKQELKDVARVVKVLAEKDIRAVAFQARIEEIAGGFENNDG